MRPKALIFAAILFASRSAWAAFGYSSTVTIDHTKVPSTQTDFPVLISLTDNRFRTIANGGNVQSATGYDIRPFSDNACSSALTYELERYNPVTGEVVMWVKIGSLSSSVDTVIYLGYGDVTIVTDGSSTSTWSNNFVSVWHLKDGTTLGLTDSSGNANTLTNVNTATAAVGQIDGGVGLLSASTQYLSVTMHPGAALTLSGWVKATTFPNSYNTLMAFTTSGKATELLVKSTGKLTPFVSATTDRFYDGTGSHTLSTGTWYYLAMTYDSSAGLVAYVNAASDGTVSANGGANTTATNGAVGEDRNTTGRRWNGTIDEPRTASVARSNDWITVEYNNQNDPSTFETLGTEGAGCPAGATPTSTPTATATFTPTPSATFTPTPSATFTPTPSATFTPTPSATFTPTPSATFTPTPTPTPLANPWFFFFPSNG